MKPVCAAPNCGLECNDITAYRVIRDGERYDYCTVECAICHSTQIGEERAEESIAELETDLAWEKAWDMYTKADAANLACIIINNITGEDDDADWMSEARVLAERILNRDDGDKPPQPASASPAKLGGPVDAFREELVAAFRAAACELHQGELGLWNQLADRLEKGR